MLVSSITRVRIATLITLSACIALISALVATPSTAHAATGLVTVQVPSAAMNKSIKVAVIRSGVPNAPTLYVLDGLRATNNENGWLRNTDIVKFFAGKRVNVVIPYGGGGSFYSNWNARDPALGKVKWETFLTRELPAYMKARQGSDGRRNAIVGLSMSGQAALNLAIHRPSMYQGVASLSGYPEMRGPVIMAGVQFSVTRMGGNPLNMWGLPYSPQFSWHNPGEHADKLRGKRIYLSAGTGLPSEQDARAFLNDPNNVIPWATQGAPLETASAASNALFLVSTAAAGVNTFTNFSPLGYHNWYRWQPRLHEAWFTTLKPALGV